MLELEIVLPEIGDLSSDTEDGDVELFLPGKSTAVPEATIEAMLAGETADKELMAIYKGAGAQQAPSQPPNTLKASHLPPVQAHSRTAYTGTDINHTVADQQAAGQIFLKGLVSSSRSSSSSTVLLAREVYQAAQLVHAALAAERHSNCSGTDRHKTAVSASFTTAAATAESPAAVAAAVALHRCEAPSSSQHTTAALLACCNSSHTVVKAGNSSNTEDAGAAQYSTGSSTSRGSSGTPPARDIVLSADELLEDLDLDDLLLRLSVGQQQQALDSSSRGCCSSSQAAAAAGHCTTLPQDSSSDVAVLYAGQAPKAARGFASEDAVQVGQSLLNGTQPHKYSSYQPRWAKQQEQQQQHPGDQPLSTYGNWKLGAGSSSTGGKLSSSSSKFCGPAGGFSPENDRLWVPPLRGTVTVDLRKETKSLLNVQTPAAADTAAAAAAVGTKKFGICCQPDSNSSAWHSSSSSASDSDSSEEDWKLFRQQVRRPGATLAQQQQ